MRQWWLRAGWEQRLMLLFGASLVAAGWYVLPLALVGLCLIFGAVR